MSHILSGNTGLTQAVRPVAEQRQHPSKPLTGTNKRVQEGIRPGSEYIAEISHDLHSPLNVIMGFSQLMLDEVLGKINEEQREGLDYILSNGRRLDTLINDVLDRLKKSPDEEL